ncbi:omptin family outer membrane protease [Paracoccus rhizosphaerae]
MATVQVRRDLAAGWVLTGSMTTSLGDGAYMSDFDWLFSGTDDWSHRSLHPDTRLDHYVDVDLAVGRDLPGPVGTTVNLHGGLRYNDVEWDARGGSLVYSFDGFRDYSADLPDGLAVVSYRQRQLSLFAGVEADRQFGDWTVSGRVRGGVGIDPRETDRHWLRDLRFDRSHDVIPFMDLAARVDYRLNDRTTAFVQARHIHHDDRRGDTRYSSISSGDEMGHAGGNAGIGFSMTQLSVGVDHSF